MQRKTMAENPQFGDSTEIWQWIRKITSNRRSGEAPFIRNKCRTIRTSEHKVPTDHHRCWNSLTNLPKCDWRTCLGFQDHLHLTSAKAHNRFGKWRQRRKRLKTHTLSIPNWATELYNNHQQPLPNRPHRQCHSAALSKLEMTFCHRNGLWTPPKE